MGGMWEKTAFSHMPPIYKDHFMTGYRLYPVILIGSILNARDKSRFVKVQIPYFVRNDDACHSEQSEESVRRQS